MSTKRVPRRKRLADGRLLTWVGSQMRNASGEVQFEHARDGRLEGQPISGDDLKRLIDE